MTKHMRTEVYSDELVRSSNIYNQLHVAITFLILELTDAENDMNSALEELSKTTGHKRDSYTIISDELVKEQIDLLKTMQVSEGGNLRRLLQKESAFDLAFEGQHPIVTGYPDWINDLFPYFQPQDVMCQISDDGGTIIRIFEDDFLAVPASVHESFIQVWWPIAGQVAEPGYLKKVAECVWASIGLER